MDNLNIPSYSHLITRDNSIKAIQELYTAINSMNSAPIKPVPSPFKQGWKINGTVDEFCEDVYGDTDCVVGAYFLGELECSNLPGGLANGEAKVEVLGDSNSKFLLITLISLTTSPYHWEYGYPASGDWRSWEVG